MAAKLAALVVVLALAGGVLAQGQGMLGGPGSSPPKESESAALQEARREIGRLIAEQRRLRARHQALQRAVTRASGVLQRQGNEGAREALANLEEALREDTRLARDGGDETTPGSTTAPAPGSAHGSTPGSTGTPGSTPAGPAAVNPDDPLSMSAGDGFFYGNVRFEQTPEGIACIGQIVNTGGDTPSVATFVLTTLDAGGQPLESTRIYVGMPRPAQPRVFRVMLTQKPPTGQFKLEHFKDTE